MTRPGGQATIRPLEAHDTTHAGTRARGASAQRCDTARASATIRPGPGHDTTGPGHDTAGPMSHDTTTGAPWVFLGCPTGPV